MVDIVHDVSDTLYRAIPSMKIELVSHQAYLEDIPMSCPDKVGKLSMYILKLPPTKNWRPILIDFDEQLDSVCYDIGVWKFFADKKIRPWL